MEPTPNSMSAAWCAARLQPIRDYLNNARLAPDPERHEWRTWLIELLNQLDKPPIAEHPTAETGVLTPEVKGELGRLASAATKGSLDVGGTRYESKGDLVHALDCETEVYPGLDCNEAGPLAIFGKPEDAEYFVAARPATVLALLAENEALTAQVAAAYPDVFAVGMSKQYQDLQQEYFAMKQRAQAAEATAAGLREEAGKFSELRGQVTAMLEDFANGCVAVKMELGKDTTPYWLGVNTERSNGLKWAELKCKELGIAWPIKPIPYAGDLPTEVPAPTPVAPVAGDIADDLTGPCHWFAICKPGDAAHCGPCPKQDGSEGATCASLPITAPEQPAPCPYSIPSAKQARELAHHIGYSTKKGGQQNG